MQHLQSNSTLQGGKYKIEKVLWQGPHSYMMCTPAEFIEDCATGIRYYLNGSSIGVNTQKNFMIQILFILVNIIPNCQIL